MTMLSFFFNRFSKAVVIAEAIGILLLPMAIARVFFSKSISAFALILFVLVLVEYAFIRFCAGRRWHKNSPRYSGIELQFKKVIVPVSYLMPATWLIFIPTLSAAPLLFAAIFLGVIAYINMTLLHFHFHDRETIPVNHFSSGAYLKDGQNE